METKHTPGPWHIGKITFDRETGRSLHGEVTRVQVPGSLEILVVRLGATQEQIDADARLIAAAPEMLEALEFLVAAYGKLESGAIDQARAAIAKAKGE